MDLTDMKFDAIKQEPSLVVRALGVAIAIPVRDVDTGVRLRRQWTRALTDDEPDARLVMSLEGLDDPIVHDYTLSTRVTMAGLEATAGERINLHAGAVADEAGRALAVVAASTGGKTTAIRALGGTLGYLSDETVSLSPEDLTVHPYAKPLSVCVVNDGTTQKESISPDDAELGPTREGARLHRIVLLRRDGSDRGLVPITTPEAIVEIVPQTSSLVLLDSPLLSLARMVDDCGGGFALHYSEIDDHVDSLKELLASDLPPPPAPVHHPPVETREAVGAEWSRTTWADAVQYDDQLVVMIGDNAHLLAGLGTTLWLALAETATLPQLIEAATQAHGPHPEAEALIEAALDVLEDSGLVARPGS